MAADHRFSPGAEAFRAEVVAWLSGQDVEVSDPLDLTGVGEDVERRIHADAGARGWLSLPVEQQAVFNFEAARADAPVIDTAMTLAGTAVQRFATNDLHRRVLADMEAGRVEACCAYTEPGAGSDLTLLSTTAVREGDGWALSGVKSLVTGAHKSDWCVTIARTDPDAAPRAAMSMFLVDMRAPGVEVRRQRTMNGWTLDEIELHDVRVPVDALLGVAGEGWRQMGAALAAERSGMFWLGFARHVLDLLAEHVCRSSRDGVLLADDPLVLDEIGRLEIAWSSADLTARRALWSQLEGVDLVAAPAMAKVVCTELLQQIAQSATEIAGADGLVWAPLFQDPDLPVGGRLAWEYLERVHATIGAGANEVHRDAIAASVLRDASRPADRQRAARLGPSDREVTLAAQAADAFAAGGTPPTTATFTEACHVTAAAGRAAPDRAHLVETWASLLGWVGDGVVAVSFDVRDDRCDHVARAGRATLLLVAGDDGVVAGIPLSDARLIPQPTLFDPDACHVELPPGWRGAAKPADVRRARALATVLLAADCVGAAAAAFDATVERVAERPMRGGVLADLQVVRHRIADMAIAVTTCWDAVLDAAARVDRDEPTDAVGIASIRAKAVAVTLGRQVTVDALRLAGGIGILEAHPWQRWYRRVKAAEPVFGSPRDHRADVARASLDRLR